MSVIAHSAAPRFDYHPASEFTAGKIGALWDVSKWKRQLFQDSAATTPVTADGQPVGCIRNSLGDTSWDLIQATAANRPVFRIIDGVPRIACGLGQGLYSRGVQALTIPAFICLGMRHNDTTSANRAILGLFKADGNQFFLSNQTLGELAADTTGVAPARARVTATSPQFSNPPNAVEAFSGLISAGLVSLRQTDMVVVGIDQATAWLDGDTVAGLTVALNGSGQNSVTKVPVSNGHADATTDFFGGMMMMGFAPANREGCRHYFRRQYDPIEKPRSTDKIYTWNSDSTGDNQLNSLVFVEPPYKIATDYFAVNHPEASVFYIEWDRQYDKLSGVQRLSTGATDARIYVYNFAVSGSDPTYFLGERWARSFGALPHISAHFINHGQNLAVPGSPTVIDPNGYLRRGQWMMHSDKMRGTFPNTPQLYVRTYEVNIAGNTTIDAVLAALDAVVASYGDGTAETDVKAKFDADGNPSSYFQTDHVHLTASGVQAYCDRAGPDITAFINALPAYVAPPLINGRKVSTNILTNGHFDDWAAGVPVGWTLGGTAPVVSKTSEKVDLAKGDRTAAKLTGDGYIQQTFDLTPYRGQALCFYVREYIVGGGDLETGQIQYLGNGTGNNAAGNSWISALNAKVNDAWIDHYLCTKPVPADATTGTVKIFCGSGASGTIYLGRVVLATGSVPKDLLA